MNRSASAALGAVALIALLAGCATSSGSAGDPTPVESDTGSEIEVDAAWLDGGRMIGLVTQGSSTCIPTASDVTLSDGSLEVVLEEPAADTPCTRDLVSRVTLVQVPEGVDPTQDLDIWVTGEGSFGETDLEGVGGLVAGGETDYLPSAGWADIDGEFLLLTWGSSTCIPVLENAEATGAAEVTLTFQTPPADQVCTMDMAPRGQVVFVDGPEEDEGVFAVLTGGEFDNVRIPIVGSN